MEDWIQDFSLAAEAWPPKQEILQIDSKKSAGRQRERTSAVCFVPAVLLSPNIWGKSHPVIPSSEEG